MTRKPPTNASNPFPQPISPDQVVTGVVDSFSPRRKDLIHSSDFLTFQATGGATSVRMDISGLGPGNNPNANDLDIFLYDRNGQLLALSDRGLNGESELIPVTLPGGTYVLEVRSYYDRGDTKKGVFNSGAYNVIVRTHP